MKSILDRQFKKKKKEYMKTSIKMDDLGKELKTIFLKSVTRDYIDSLTEAVDRTGNDKDKSDFNEFNKKFNEGTITVSDMGLFEYIDEVYKERILEETS